VYLGDKLCSMAMASQCAVMVKMAVPRKVDSPDTSKYV
jgi:hypothetical protein